MLQSARFSRVSLLLVVAALAAVAAQPVLGGDVQSFQFTDAYYLQNGIDPSGLTDYYTFPDAKFGATCDTATGGPAPPCRTRLADSPDPSVYTDINVIEITGGFMHNGNLLYYNTPSKIFLGDFTNNALGDNAHQICNDFLAYLFPKAAGDPLGPGPPNRRQDNIFATRSGYFNNNPLGCWRLTFVAWDGPEVNGPDCQHLLADLEEENGLDLDGTSIIRREGDIEKGLDLGCVTARQRRETGVDGFPWVT